MSLRQISASAMASPDDVWLVEFGDPYPGEPAHHRPALVIGPDVIFGPNFPFVIVAPMTTSFRGLSLHVAVEPSDETGVDDVSYVQCELLRSINRRRLVTRLGAVGSDTSAEVERAVRTLLGF